MIAALLLSGCTVSPEPGPSQTRSASAAPSASASGEPGPSATSDPAPTLVPDGSAADNLPIFAATVGAVFAGPDALSGRAYVDALVSVGFDKAAMQVTQDLTTVGNPAESIQVSVRWGDECLVGQVGPATGAPVATVLPGLAEGGCLIGQTRPIDW